MTKWTKELLNLSSASGKSSIATASQHDKRVRTTHGVNCTGSCSWEVFVKDGIVTWELQATDYPLLEEGLPPYEPRGCQRGISYSWYLYSPIRVKYPYVRGALLDLWRDARREIQRPGRSMGTIVANPEDRKPYTNKRAAKAVSDALMG